MRSIASRLNAFCLLVGLATAVTACEFVPDREFEALQHNLSLRIVSAKRLENDKADFGFTLTNQGKTDANACLGPSRSVSYRGGPASGTSSDSVDHAGCALASSRFNQAGCCRGTRHWRCLVCLNARLKWRSDVQITNPRRAAIGATAPSSSFSRTRSRFHESGSILPRHAEVTAVTGASI